MESQADIRMHVKTARAVQTVLSFSPCHPFERGNLSEENCLWLSRASKHLGVWSQIRPLALRSPHLDRSEDARPSPLAPRRGQNPQARLNPKYRPGRLPHNTGRGSRCGRSVLSCRDGSQRRSPCPAMILDQLSYWHRPRHRLPGLPGQAGGPTEIHLWWRRIQTLLARCARRDRRKLVLPKSHNSSSHVRQSDSLAPRSLRFRSPRKDRSESQVRSLLRPQSQTAVRPPPTDRRELPPRRLQKGGYKEKLVVRDRTVQRHAPKQRMVLSLRSPPS